MNDDSNLYYSYCHTERPTGADLEDMVDIFARQNIDTLTQCVHCRWQAFYDSRVVEIAGDLTPEAVKPWEHVHYWQWLTCLQRLIAEGNDPPKVLAEACHRRKMRFLPSFRLNDQHGMHPHEGQYGSFRRDHPEWIAAGKAMDYGVPEVREHILSVAAELAERYDIDGIDLDFVRWPIFFKDDQVKSNTPLMTELVRQIRSILDKAGAKRNRRMLLSARVPLNVGTGRTINTNATDRDLECLGIGLDVPAWIRDQLIDVVMPMHFFYTTWDTMIANLDEWRGLTDGTPCGLYPTIHSMAWNDYGPPYISAQSYRGAAHSYYQSGADGIALYNLWSGNKVGWGAVRDMGSPIALGSKPRRYHCHLDELEVVSQGAQAEFELHLPEDPSAPQLSASLNFTAVNLTLEHVLEVDLNGKPVDMNTARKSRRLPEGNHPGSGNPHLPYFHRVEIPLAGTAAIAGRNVLSVKLVKINDQIPSKDTIEVGRIEVLVEPTTS